MSKNRQPQTTTTATETTNTSTDAPSISSSELTELATATQGEQLAGDASGTTQPPAGDQPVVEGVTEQPKLSDDATALSNETPSAAVAAAGFSAPVPLAAAPAPAPTELAGSPTETPSTTTEIEGKNVVVVEGDVSPAGLVKAIIDKAASEATPAGALVLRQLGEYMENMKPKRPINPTDGARHQVTLYRSLTRAINSLGDDFPLVFTTILRLFNEHSNGVFGDAYIFRFMEVIALPEADRKAFQRLVNMIKNTADPKTRAHSLKFTDLHKSMEFGLTEQGRSNLLTYFNK